MEGAPVPIRRDGFPRFLIVRRQDGEKFRLTIPIEDAFGFSMGEFDLGRDEPRDGMRQLVGVMVIDALQYAEYWSVAAEVRAALAERWPDCPAFQPAKN